MCVVIIQHTFDTCHMPYPQQIPMNMHPSLILACSQLLSAAAQDWPFPFFCHSEFMCLHVFCLPLPHCMVCFQSYSSSFGSSANFSPSSSSCLPEQAPPSMVLTPCFAVSPCHLLLHLHISCSSAPFSVQSQVSLPQLISCPLPTLLPRLLPYSLA